MVNIKQQQKKVAQEIKGFTEQSGSGNGRNRIVPGILVTGTFTKSLKLVLLKLSD